jgi:hypothetical protein
MHFIDVSCFDLNTSSSVSPQDGEIASNCITLVLGRGPAPNRHAIVPFGQPELDPMVLMGKQIRSKPTKHMYNTTIQGVSKRALQL